MLEMDRGELELIDPSRDGGTTTPDSHVTQSRLLPSRLATDVIKRVAVE